jgi:hypothetical protein
MERHFEDILTRWSIHFYTHEIPCWEALASVSMEENRRVWLTVSVQVKDDTIASFMRFLDDFQSHIFKVTYPG